MDVTHEITYLSKLLYWGAVGAAALGVSGAGQCVVCPRWNFFQLPPGDCGSCSRLAFAIGSEHLVNGCKRSPLHAFAVAPSLKWAFVDLSKYILSGVRATRLPGGDESAWVSLAVLGWPRNVAPLGRLERAQIIIMLSTIGGVFSPLSTSAENRKHSCFLGSFSQYFQDSLTLFPPPSRISCPWYLASQARQRRHPHIPYTIFLFSGY